jgi:type I restriction enzyme S subunit
VKSGTKKRILFLVDRNILADQTKTNDFKPFGQAMAKITNRTVDKAFEIYLALYQAVSGTDDKQNVYKQFSSDCFNLVIVDECHRGSAADVTNPPFGGMEEDGIEANFPAEFRTRETADLFLVLLMKRIVAKVDELMALCDRLGAQQQERETRHAALARASLATFADAPTPANLDLLFHKSYSILPADLRKSILTLAVRGKLVPQDPQDGDARELIDRAMETRLQTIESKNLGRKQLDESAQLFSPNDLPSSWCIERFANLVDPENTISYGVLVPGNDVPDGVPFVRAQDLSLSNHPARPNKTISPEIEKPYVRTRLTGGEILLCVVGSIGKLGIVPESWAGANIARAVARIKPISDVDRDYLLIVLQETAVQTFFLSATRTLAQPTLNVGLIEQTPIPIPPIAEQRRIAAKVDELVALVDALETQLAAARITGENLVEAVVAELTAEA